MSYSCILYIVVGGKVILDVLIIIRPMLIYCECNFAIS